MQTFTRTDFGRFGERRLVLEPAFLAVMLAGGVGAFIQYGFPYTASLSQIPAWGAVTRPERIELAPAAAVTSAMQIPVNFGSKAPQFGNLQSPAAARSEEPEVSIVNLPSKQLARSGSFLSRLNGSASKQNYVIRLTFPEPSAVDLAVIAKSSSPGSGAFVGDALSIAESGPTTGSIDLAKNGLTADGAVERDPVAVVGIQNARLAELKATSAVEPQRLTGIAVLPLEESKFDLALVPKRSSRAAELRTASANTNRKASPNPTVQPIAKNRAGLRLAEKKDRVVGEFIFHRTAVQLNDSSAAEVDVRIGGDTSLSMRVSALLAIVEGQMDPTLFAAMSASAGASDYVSFAEIRSAGIDVGYDAAADRIVLTAD